METNRQNSNQQKQNKTNLRGGCSFQRNKKLGVTSGGAGGQEAYGAADGWEEEGVLVGTDCLITDLWPDKTETSPDQGVLIRADVPILIQKVLKSDPPKSCSLLHGELYRFHS